MKGRSPKSEGRSEAEIRSLKAEGDGGCRTGAVSAESSCERVTPTMSRFGFRASAFLRTSDFGLRTLVLAACSLIGRTLHAAATDVPSSDEIPLLRPPHAEIPPNFWDQYGAWVILAVILVLALVGAAIWLFTRPKPPVIVQPAILARQALEPLRRRPEDGLLLSRVSQILRHYIITAFGMPPGELTTAEFCHAIAAHAQVGPALASALSDFLRLCDYDKFSPPTPAPPLNAVARALTLVDQSQARLTALSQPASPPHLSPTLRPPQPEIPK